MILPSGIDLRRTLFLLSVLILLSSPLCHAQPSWEVGMRVEVDGDYRDGILYAQKVVVEVPDPYPEIKGFATKIDPRARTLLVPPFHVEIDDETDIDDDRDEGDSYRLHELRKDWRLKIEVEVLGPNRVRAIEIDVDRYEPDRQLELESEIQAVEQTPDGTVLVILGVRCLVTKETIVPEETISQARPRLVDEDERRPREQLKLFDRLTIGGDLQVDWEYEDDFDLDENDNEDLLEFDTSVNLEATLEISRNSYAFAKVRSAKSYVIFDEDRDRSLRERSQTEELNLYWGRIFDQPLALLVGRQDFDERREWLYDENLDGVRVFWNPKPFELEYSWSRFLHDAPRGRSDTLYHILMARWWHEKKSYVGAYMIDIRDDSDADVSPFFVGIRAHGRPRKSVRYWLDYAYLDGVEGVNELQAHGGDAGCAYQFRDLPWRPYVFAGYAFGSGDRNPNNRTDREFRQTGLHDNNARLFGNASYRYYGELLRPELSNLHVLTLGFGVLPLEWLSVDFVYHEYRQDTTSPRLRDTELRQRPNGLSRDLGREFDMVIGLEEVFGRFDAELDVGYFEPGSAFDTNNHPALWVALQLEWNF